MTLTREKQIKAVEKLGKQIGYGNLMYLATGLWRRELKNKGYPVNGAFVPTIMSMMNQDGKQVSEIELVNIDKTINKYYDGKKEE